MVLAMIISMPLMAQNFDVTDTTTEYTIKGTRYSDIFEGRRTASGEVFKQNLYTAAHNKIKLGTLVMVTNPESNKQLIVKINDRCPKKNLIDLTKRAAKELKLSGCKPVKIRILPSTYQDQWEQQKGPIDLIEDTIEINED